MREIKFRAKSYGSIEWIYGGGVVVHPEKPSCSAMIHSHGPSLQMTLVHTDTVGQFAGFKDEYGREVYEGDIGVCKRYPFYGDAPEINTSSGLCQELNYRGVVEWFEEDACFYLGLVVVSSCVRGAACGGMLSEYVGGLEIVGNIHENPDLLKVPGEA